VVHLEENWHQGFWLAIDPSDMVVVAPPFVLQVGLTEVECCQLVLSLNELLLLKLNLLPFGDSMDLGLNFYADPREVGRHLDVQLILIFLIESHLSVALGHRDVIEVVLGLYRDLSFL